MPWHVPPYICSHYLWGYGSSLKHHINSAVFALPFALITDRGYCLSPNIVYASSKDISCFGSSSLTSFHLRENEGKYGHLRTPSTAIAARGLMPLLSVRTQYLHPSQFFNFSNINFFASSGISSNLLKSSAKRGTENNCFQDYSKPALDR